MLTVTLLCVGKLGERHWRDAAAEYAKRLSRFCNLQITEIDEFKTPQNPSAGEIARTVAEEGKRIGARIPAGARVFSLCIEAKQKTSEQFAQNLEQAAQTASHLVFIIGGSHGISDDIKALSQERLSISPMTFPHQLARVLLLEQLYRAFQINSGGSYHK